MRRPLLLTAALCVLLVVLSLLASRRAAKMDLVLERDGSRTISRRLFGFIPTSRIEPDPSLHVSDDLRKELKRLSIKLSPALDRLVSGAMRQTVTSLQVRYSFGGEVSAAPKDVVDTLARQIPHPRRWTAAKDDQFNGTCADGRSEIDLIADASGGTTWVNFGLQVLPGSK